jgi:uncharacterized delta-60 repeat protein
VDRTNRVVVTGRAWPEGVLTLRLGSRGTLDRSFASRGFTIERYFDDAVVNRGIGLGARGDEVQIGADGRITVAGSIYRGIASQSTILLHRYEVDGRPSESFSARSLQYDPSDSRGPWLGALALAGDGSLWIAGRLANDVLYAHHDPDGSLDAHLALDLGSGDEQAWSGAIDAAGRFVSVGQRSTRTFVARHLPNDDPEHEIDPAIDRSFAKGGRLLLGARGFASYVATDLALAPRGRIVVAGVAEPQRSTALRSLVITRLTASGSLDRTFRTRR